MYTGHNGEQFLEHFCKHCCNIENRPDNSELAKYFNENYDVNNNLIKCNHIKKLLHITAAGQRYYKDKRVCGLKALVPHGFNTGNGDYAKEMSNFC